MRAVIFHDVGKPITIENVEIDEPMAGEVLVKTAASGICGSDLHYFDGTSAMPYPPSSATRAQASSRQSVPASRSSSPATT